MSERGNPPLRDEDDDVAARVAAVLKIGAPLAVIFLAVGVGVLRGAPLAILVLAAGALAAVIALFWQSVRTLVGETPLSGADAFAIAAPRAEEEKKRAVLRALKDLEFERSVGKISEADYDQLVLQYRAEARSLLQQLDDSAKPRRDRVMDLVDQRLRRAGLGGVHEVRAVIRTADSKASTPGTAPVAAEPALAEPVVAERAEPIEAVDDAAVGSDDAEDEVAVVEPARATCPGCAASNEIDAAFCKKCGARMTSAGKSSGEADADAS